MSAQLPSRVQSLASRLQELQQSLENEKVDRLHAIEHNFQRLDEQIAQQQFAQESRFKLIRDELSAIDERLKSCESERKLLDERSAQVTKELDGEFHQSLAVSKQTTKDAEINLSKLIEDKFFAIGVELAELRRQREVDEGKLSADQSEQLSRLQFDLDREQRTMNEQAEKILQRMLEEVQRLHGLVELERRVRSEAAQSMARMFEELSAKITRDVEVNRREREEAEDGMMRVIEETCTRVVGRSTGL